MSGIWYIVVPEAGRNYVKNPSAELDGNFDVLHAGSPSTSISPSGSASPSGSSSPSASRSNSPSASQSRSPSASSSRSPSASASPSGSVSPSASVSVSPSPSAGIAAVARVTTRARFGNYCYQVTPTSAYDGFALDLATLANAIHYVSLYISDDITGLPQVALDGRAFYDMTEIGGMSGRWLRYGVQIPAANASGSVRLDIRLTTSETFFVDAVQVEQNSYGTTYIDGDRAGLYKWTGLRHGSASTRSAQERSGGRERNLLDDYGVEVVEGTKRIGVPPITHNLTSQSLLPGAQYQSSKVLPREIELHLNYSSDTWAGFHSKRADVINLLKPDLVRGAQPIVIGYAGSGTDNKLYSSFYYSGGMEFGDFLAYDEIAPVRLLAPDPFWYADTQQTLVMDYQDSLTADFAYARINGAWGRLSTGFDNVVNAIAVDEGRGRVYFGGQFTTAGGVSVNGICYWDGVQFVSMRGGVGSSVNVNALAIAPNGDVWVGGSFTTVGGATSNYVAKWIISTNTWTTFGTVGTGIVTSISISPSGTVYVGGLFTNWNGSANSDYIVSYNGVSWSSLGTGSNAAIAEIVAYSDNVIYIGGQNDTLNGVTVNGICYWNGNTAVAMGSGVASNIDVRTIAIGKNGDVYIGGGFTTVSGNNYPAIARWNGSAWFSLGGASYFPSDYLCTSIAVLNDGSVVVGIYDTAPSVKTYLYLWNGSAFSPLDLENQFSGILSCIGVFASGDYYIGLDGAISKIAGIISAENIGSAGIFPRLDVINGNSSGSCTVQWLENQSSDHVIYFDLDIQAGEMVTLDLSNSQKALTSNWRGRITDNPLANSDVVNFRLLPGDNTISALVTGTVTSVVALLHWTPRYWSADGNA